jgi:hypothetical protein
MTAEQFDSAVAGLVSRPAREDDEDWVRELRTMLSRPDLRELLGPRRAVAEQLVEALARRARPTSRPPL